MEMLLKQQKPRNDQGVVQGYVACGENRPRTRAQTEVRSGSHVELPQPYSSGQIGDEKRLPGQRT